MSGRGKLTGVAVAAATLYVMYAALGGGASDPAHDPASSKKDEQIDAEKSEVSTAEARRAERRIRKEKTSERGRVDRSGTEKSGPDASTERAERKAEPEETSTPGESNATAARSRSKTEALYRRAVKARRLGSPDKAQAALEELLAEDPDHAGALAEMGFLQLEVRGDPHQAIDYLQRSLESKPDPTGDAVGALIESYVRSGREEDGIAFMSDMVEKRPDSYEANFGNGDLLARTGRVEEALPYLEKAASVREADGEPAVALGDAYLASGRNEQAARQFKKAVKYYEKLEEKLKTKDGEPLPEQKKKRMARDAAMTKFSYAVSLVKLGRTKKAKSLLKEIDDVAPQPARQLRKKIKNEAQSSRG